MADSNLPVSPAEISQLIRDRDRDAHAVGDNDEDEPEQEQS